MSEMKKHHQEILTKEKQYLLHNITPTCDLWASFTEKDIFSDQMIEDIKERRTGSEQISRMLELLPRRGPYAFEDFCEVLLESSHSFVAEYLLKLNAMHQLTDAFKKENQISNQERLLQDQIPDLYKKMISPFRRFFERRVDLEIRQQANSFQDIEDEKDSLMENLNKKETECNTLRFLLKKIMDSIHSVASEINRELISRYQLNEQKKSLETLTLSSTCYDDEFNQWKNDMLSIVNGLEEWSNTKSIRNMVKNSSTDDDEFNTMHSRKRVSTRRRIAYVMKVIEDIMHRLPADNYGKCILELSEGLGVCKQIEGDINLASSKYKEITHKFDELSQEVLSLISSHFMIREHEEEIKEKDRHINSVRSHTNTLKKKTRKHPRQLEMFQKKVEEYKEDVDVLKEKLMRRHDSADDRIRCIFEIVPDENDCFSPVFSTGSRRPSDITIDEEDQTSSDDRTTASEKSVSAIEELVIDKTRQNITALKGVSSLQTNKRNKVFHRSSDDRITTSEKSMSAIKASVMEKTSQNITNPKCDYPIKTNKGGKDSSRQNIEESIGNNELQGDYNYKDEGKLFAGGAGGADAAANSDQSRRRKDAGNKNTSGPQNMEQKGQSSHKLNFHQGLEKDHNDPDKIENVTRSVHDQKINASVSYVADGDTSAEKNVEHFTSDDKSKPLAYNDGNRQRVLYKNGCGPDDDDHDVSSACSRSASVNNRKASIPERKPEEHLLGTKRKTDKKVDTSYASRRLSVSIVEFEGICQEEPRSNLQDQGTPRSDSDISSNECVKEPPRDASKAGGISSNLSSKHYGKSENVTDLGKSMNKTEVIDGSRSIKNVSHVPTSGFNGSFSNTPKGIRNRPPVERKVSRADERRQRQELPASKVTLC